MKNVYVFSKVVTKFCSISILAYIFFICQYRVNFMYMRKKRFSLYYKKCFLTEQISFMIPLVDSITMLIFRLENDVKDEYINVELIKYISIG